MPKIQTKHAKRTTIKESHMSERPLQEIARQLRLDILESTTKAGSGHPSSSWSSVEILTALYFGGILAGF